jgi:rare lipoprotein A
VASGKNLKGQRNRGFGWLSLLSLAALAQGCAAISGRPNWDSSVSPTSPAQANVATYPGRTETLRSDVVKSSNVGSSPQEKLKRPSSTLRGKVLTGTASWYGPGFNGKKTASGDIFDDSKFTAATKILPLGSKVRVTNLSTGDSVNVEVNDRGPFVDGRIIDLSHAAARALGIVDAGTAKVKVELLFEADESVENNRLGM